MSQQQIKIWLCKVCKNESAKKTNNEDQRRQILNKTKSLGISESRILTEPRVPVTESSSYDVKTLKYDVTTLSNDERERKKSLQTNRIKNEFFPGHQKEKISILKGLTFTKRWTK